MEQVVDPLLQPIKSWVVTKVEEQFSYAFSNKKHFEELVKEVKKLQRKKGDTDELVEDAKRQGETIKPEVDDWQKEADEIITNSEKFIEETKNSDAACFFKLCYNVVHLYKSGKEAAMFHKKVTDKYQEATSFGAVSKPPPVPDTVVSRAATSGGELTSREKILDEVVSALQDDTIDVVGIHGMGGVGKTTLVDKLIVRAKEGNLFKVVVKAEVSRTIDIRGIQNLITEKIRFKFQAESTQGRKDELCQILSHKPQNDGKILVILDDVWEAVDITTQIGIPRMSCCKVVITTRIIDILRGEPINARRLFEVGVLDGEEAEVLFGNSLGEYRSTVANNSQYNIVMKDLLERCGGLPLALVTLASTLKCKDHHMWEDARYKLSNHSGKKMEEMSKKVLSVIQFSFDYLQNEEAKKVLLLCSLFPEGAKIPMQKLVSYGFGIDLFEDSCRLDEAMRQVHGFIDRLISCSLLLSAEPEDKSDSYYVRVHDVIRVVVLDIASKGTSLPKGKGLHAISLSIEDFENREWQLLDVSKLRVLRLQCKYGVRIPTDFFKDMEKLKVLDLVVHNVESFPVLGPLSSLEHLFVEDHNITELTTTFNGFKYLKVLDLSKCPSLKGILANFRSSLPQLEGVFLAKKQPINLGELQCCSRLQILHAGLKVAIGQQIPCEVESNFKHLRSFKLVISGGVNKFTFDGPSKCLTDKLFPKTLTVKGIHSLMLISIIDILPRGLHSLCCIEVEGLTSLKMVDSSILRGLVVNDCIEVRCLFGANVGLSNLEYISLYNLPLLEGICEPKELRMVMPNIGTNTTSRAMKNHLFPPQELLPASGASFSQLRVLEIIELPRVTSVFPSLSLFKQMITSLQHLLIEDCESLEEVIASAVEEGDEMDVAAYNPITLSLKELYLFGLSSLLHFYGGKHTLNFPHLPDITISRCDTLKSLAAILSREGPLGILSRVCIADCKDMKYVFAADVVPFKLMTLELRALTELEGICGHDGGALWKNSFPTLSDLTLNSLPKIMNNNITADSREDARVYLFGHEDVLPAIETMTLWEMGCAEIWHSPPATTGSFSQLCRLEIIGLPHIKHVFPSLAFCTQLTRLEQLEIRDCENLEEVVYYEGGDEQVEDNQLTIISVFPALKYIRLSEVPKLKHFYEGRYTLKFPLLDEVDISRCKGLELLSYTLPDAPNLILIDNNQSTSEISMSNIMTTNQDSHDVAKKYLFGPKELLPASGASFSQLRVLEIIELPRVTSVFPSLSLYKQAITTLRELYIANCGSLEEVIASAVEEGDEMDVAAYNPITLSLEKLHLDNLPSLLHFYGGKHALNFPRLRDITILRCDTFKSLAPILSKEGLGRLEIMDVDSCKDMKYVFAADVVPFKLMRLKLRTLPELEGICGHDGGALWKNSFPALSDLTLNSLPKIMNNNIIADSHEDARVYLFGHEDVLPKIKTIDLTGMGCAQIWHFPPATTGSFSQLKRLKINAMPRLKYVFPSITFCTHLLTRLRELDICGCENLEEVVYYEGGDEQVEDNQRTIISVFPALYEIKLHKLPKLKHLYGGRHTLKFPLWHELTIRGCESMKSFTSTLPDAPNLTYINNKRSTPEISMSKIMAIDQANTCA